MFDFLCKVHLIQVTKQPCIQLRPPTTSSSSSSRSRRRRRQQQLLQQLLGQGPPSLKKHHSKINNWNQNSLPNHPRFTTVMFVRSAVLDHRYLCCMLYHESSVVGFFVFCFFPVAKLKISDLGKSLFIKSSEFSSLPNFVNTLFKSLVFV